jgi:ADP-heptose:LPS heptosyltransferase
MGESSVHGQSLDVTPAHELCERCPSSEKLRSLGAFLDLPNLIDESRAGLDRPFYNAADTISTKRQNGMQVILDRRYIKKRKKLNLAIERSFVTLMNLGRRRSVPRPEQVRSILIVRHNQLGDAVAASPFIEAVRSLWPHARVEVLAGKDNFEAFSWVQGVDQVHLLPPGASWLERVRLYRSFAGRFDIVFQTLLDELYMTRALAARAMAGPGLAVGRARGSPMEELYDQRPYMPAGCYVGQLMALLSPFTPLTAQDLVTRHPRHRVNLPAVAQQAARARLAQLGLQPQTYVALNISARVSFRELGVEQAAALTRRLSARGLPVLLLHAPSDQARADRVKQLAPEVTLAQAGSLGEAMALAQMARLYMGADTGTAHFAAAGGAPCMVLFSYQARADIWSPYGVPFVSIQANPDQPVADLDQDLIFEYTERLLTGEALMRIVKSTPQHFSSGGQACRRVSAA